MIVTIEKVQGHVGESWTEYALKCLQDGSFRSFGGGFDAEVVCETLRQYSNDDDKCFFVAKVNDKVIGAFLGEYKCLPFSTWPIAVELYFSVLPDFRGHGISQSLIKCFSEWAKLKGCKFLVCGVNCFSSSDTEQARIRLAKEGFKPFGFEYYREL